MVSQNPYGDLVSSQTVRVGYTSLNVDAVYKSGLSLLHDYDGEGSGTPQPYSDKK